MNSKATWGRRLKTKPKPWQSSFLLHGIKDPTERGNLLTTGEILKP